MEAKLTITERDGKVDWADAVIDLDGERCTLQQSTLQQIFGAFKSAKAERDELLEALKRVAREDNRQDGRDFRIGQHVMAAVKAAIAKAEGRA